MGNVKFNISDDETNIIRDETDTTLWSQARRPGCEKKRYSLAVECMLSKYTNGLY